jgi:hypothetical protein
MTPMFWVALAMVAGGLWPAIFWWRRRRWLLLVIGVVLFAFNLTALAAQTWFSIVNLREARAVAECANAPKELPFHQGIILCPGQSAIMRIELPVPETPDRAI